MHKEKKQAKFLKTRVTFLEMDKKPSGFYAVPVSGKPLALMRIEDCPIHFYRYLYEQVGRLHHWQTRRKQSDATVTAILHADTTDLHVLYCGGCPAGFAETIFHEKDGHHYAEILYFGLLREYQGRGLSRFFLSEILHACWTKDIEKIVLQTNSLDNPQALQLYQKVGFVPVGVKDIEIESWN